MDGGNKYMSALISHHLVYSRYTFLIDDLRMLCMIPRASRFVRYMYIHVHVYSTMYNICEVHVHAIFVDFTLCLK